MKRLLPNFVKIATRHSLLAISKQQTANSKQPQKGFTLIELLVVVTIIAILSVIGITVFGGLTTRARDQRIKADIDSIAKAFEANFDPEPGEYTAITGADFASGKVPKHPSRDAYTCSAGPNPADDADLPCTANAATFTVCGTLSDTTDYCLSAAQESTSVAPPPPAP